MVLLLTLNVLQNSLELARTYRKRAVAALPKKRAITSVKLLDPFRRCFLYLLNELSLGKSSRQRRHNVNVIGDTADTHKFCAEVAADCCQISTHPRPHV
jgi:hypothetical protein